MQNRTWNVKLSATDDFPETTLDGVAHEDVVKLMRGLMHGPPSTEYERVKAATRSPRVARAS